MHCDMCKQDKEIYNCDGCKKAICKACGDLTASEVKCLQLKERKLKFYCSQCLSLDTFSLYKAIIQEKCNLIDNKNKIIELLEQDIKELKEKLNKEQAREPTYSEVAGTKKEEVLVIKPKNERQKSKITSEAVQEKIDPSSLGAVSKFKHVRNGGVAICCNNEKPIENVCKEIEQKLGQDYQVSKIEKKNPKIKVKNVAKRDLEDEAVFIEKVILQNTIQTKAGTTVIKIVHKYVPKTKNANSSKVNEILEVDPATYSYISKKDVLCIGWGICKYEDYVNIIQCYKCWKFGHMAKDCRNEKQICADCAGEHHSCKSEEKVCVNCKYAAEVLKIPNVSISHPAYDKRCIAYKRIYDQLKMKIDYSHTSSGAHMIQ